MKPLPQVELPDEDSDECRALMVVIPVLTDPTSRSLVPYTGRRKYRRSRRASRKSSESIAILIIKDCFVPMSMSVLALTAVLSFTQHEGLVARVFADNTELVQSASNNVPSVIIDDTRSVADNGHPDPDLF